MVLQTDTHYELQRSFATYMWVFFVGIQWASEKHHEKVLKFFKVQI